MAVMLSSSGSNLIRLQVQALGGMGFTLRQPFLSDLLGSTYECKLGVRHAQKPLQFDASHSILIT